MPNEVAESALPRPGSSTAAGSSGTITTVPLAFVAGFVDTAGFVGLFGLFTAHVTGNFVLIGVSLATNTPGIVDKLLAFPVFLVAVALTRLYQLRSEQLRLDPQRPVLLAEAAFLTLLLAAGLAAEPIEQSRGPYQPWVLLAQAAAVIAMAIQNAAARTVFAAHAPTTVMTGNVTQVVMDLVDLALGRTAGAKQRLRKMVPPLLAFAAGAIAAGLGFLWWGFWCVVVPLTVVLLLIVLRR
jgi:uncharacterized membrane protein YoaK (UPF0700 family)